MCLRYGRCARESGRGGDQRQRRIAWYRNNLRRGERIDRGRVRPAIEDRHFVEGVAWLEDGERLLPAGARGLEDAGAAAAQGEETGARVAFADNQLARGELTHLGPLGQPAQVAGSNAPPRALPELRPAPPRAWHVS